MAKKKAVRGPGVGTRVRVRDGVCVPEFPSVTCSGWTGSVADIIGGKANPRYVVEWDASTLQAMPPDYVGECERQSLLHTMACLPPESLEFLP